MTEKTKGIIYMLTNQINDKKYIGQTVNLERRIKEHRENNRQVVEKAIDQHGWNNFELTILEKDIDSGKLNEKEKKYINQYDTFESQDYNLTEGGEHYELTPDIRKKISAAHKDKNYDYSGAKNPFYGGRHTQESKRKMSKNHGDNSGLKNGRSKISSGEAIEIREEYKDMKNATTRSLAMRYKVSKQTIWNIISGKHWATRNLENISKENIGENKANSNLTEKKIKVIKYLLQGGQFTQKQIGRMYDVARKTINNINIERTWDWVEVS